MRDIAHILAFFLRAEGRRLTLGVMLLAATLAAGAGLLAVSGWLIAGAGLAGLGLIVFDTMRPSAGIRFFAIFRTVARYLERLANHDATLRILAVLRVAAFRGIAARPTGLRQAHLLARLSSDVDALDGLTIRLAGPLVAGLAVAIGGILLLATVSWTLAAVIALPAIAGGLLLPLMIGLSARRDMRRRIARWTPCGCGSSISTEAARNWRWPAGSARRPTPSSGLRAGRPGWRRGSPAGKRQSVSVRGFRRIWRSALPRWRAPGWSRPARSARRSMSPWSLPPLPRWRWPGRSGPARSISAASSWPRAGWRR
ncbi:hypothetical protein [Methylobrevis pamukkalensis]|uniref:Cysteine/glutathione ABC transporter membrane/ATP-binding component n=1 Tax=Methylobrevis pamukkalensis TaxID=1439726 RepID=A0A1E3H6H0_9HYPH|nr:hypothetical protein [Methylobrevis pamukkalensis]ODN71912.1 cysteine/glutathione ABC transporter membrane/ATP-binding component [Methylobrevis pamukkalensis]